jgi:hypothetical protein
MTIGLVDLFSIKVQLRLEGLAETLVLCLFALVSNSKKDVSFIFFKDEIILQLYNRYIS